MKGLAARSASVSKTGLREPPAREAGAHAWRQAHWRLVVILVIRVAIFVGAGFGLATSGFVGIGIGLFGLIVLALLERWVEGGWLNALPWITGYRGERTVGDLLAMLSPLGYKVVHGIPYTDDYGTHNIDHTVVGPSGIYAVETKNWTGALWRVRCTATLSESSRPWTRYQTRMATLAIRGLSASGEASPGERGGTISQHPGRVIFTSL